MAPRKSRDDLLFLLMHTYMTLNDLCRKLRDAVCDDLDDVLAVMDKENEKHRTKEQKRQVKNKQ